MYAGPLYPKRLTVTDTPAPVPSRRGFAGMDPARRSEIARKGGQAVAKENRSFSKNRDLAAEAGRKGGTGGAGKPKKSV